MVYMKKLTLKDILISGTNVLVKLTSTIGDKVNPMGSKM